MTCIVGFIDKENNSVLIGGDSAESNGVNIFIRKDSKVFKNGDFVIGCTSSFRMIQLLKFSFTPPPIGDKDIYEYMCTDFIKEVRICFNKGGFMQKNQEGDDMGGDFLIGYKDRLFRVEPDFQVAETLDNYIAIGSGQDFALGSMCILSKSEISSEQKIIKALEASEYLSIGVKRPFYIEKTK